MKLASLALVAVAATLMLSGCIFPGEYWGGRHHDRGGDYGNGGHHGDHHGDHRDGGRGDH